MTIPESQLSTWSAQGSVTQSAATYATIKTNLEDASAAYGSKSYSIFLQGSYGNDTNIYADSDVDVVIAIESVYYSDTSELKGESLASYQAAFSRAEYQYADFKRDVIAQLRKKFGDDVDPGKKAIFVKGRGSRRDADVLPAAEYRRYTGVGLQYQEGIVFWTTDDVKIVNYPRQHSANCTSKHQSTASWFKPTVRVFKNMRNAMIASGYLAEGVAPSYFIEGMLYNVPNDKFGGSFQSTFVDAINWLVACDRTKLECANEMYFLLHPTSPVTWRAEHMQRYLDAVIKFWNDW